jgi:lipopolysaccharide export LptBFGC system permease protein LptF
MKNPFIIVRTKVGPSNWIVEGQIKADSAIYVDNRWVMTNGVYRQIATDPDADMDSLISTDIKSFESDLTPNEIPMKRQESYKSLLSFSQLNAMTQKGISIKDKTELYSQKHQRITDPIINIIMLMLALPVLVCRDPKAMKSAILKSFTITGACYIATFASKMLSTESLLTQVGPEFWAWLPVFIFFPIGLIELDSMKT